MLSFIMSERIRARCSRSSQFLLRLVLAALIGFWTPFAQATEPSFDALSHLLRTYAGPVDEKAVDAASEDVPAESGAQLAKIQSDLSLMAEGFEAFRHPRHAQHALQDLPDHIVPELRPFFKDRDSTLDTVYRTLAVADYTWALRFPEPTCDPRARRNGLLGSKDGLFVDLKSGTLSPWLARLLGPAAYGRTAEDALDRASGKQSLSERDYELLRVKVAKISEALISDKAIGKERSKLYCLRAEAYETLASEHRAAQGAPIEASRESGAADATTKEAASVLLIAIADGPTRFRAVGAGVMVETAKGPRVLSDARLAPPAGEDQPALRGFTRAGDGSLSQPRDFVVERMDQASGVMVGRLEGAEKIPTLRIARGSVARRDLLRAIGHMSASGAWTVSRGLVTETGGGTFSSDAILGPDMLGSPLLNDSGEVVGLVVLSPGAGAPAAVYAEHLSRVADGDLPAARDLEFVASRQTGSASLLSTAMPLVGEIRTPGGGAIEAGLPNSLGGVNWSGGGGVGNWRPKSSAGRPSGSYSSSGSSSYSSYGSGKSAGTEIGEALAPLVEAMIFKGIPALFRGIGSLFKSKPRASTSTPRRAAAQESAREAEKPPEPPKITGLTLTVTPDEGLEGETLTATAVLSFSGDKPKRDGINVVFTNDATGRIIFPNNQAAYSAPTDASGKATISFELNASHRERERPFDELKDEERRRAGEETPSRMRPDRKPKNAFEKVKQRAPDAFDSLDREDDTQREVDSTGESASPESPAAAADWMTNAAVLVGPTPVPPIFPPTVAPVQPSLIATIKLTASASSGTMGSAVGDAKVKVVSEVCPPGTVTADPPETPMPGHAPIGSPHKALLEEKCRPPELEAERTCGNNQTCRDAKLRARGYDFRACVNRWNQDSGSGAGSIGAPPPPKPNKRPVRCVPKGQSAGQAKTRQLTLYAQKSEDGGPDGERHGGFVSRLKKMSLSEIMRTIRSLAARILEHQKKIADAPDSIHAQHWGKEIRTFSEQKALAEAELASRGHHGP